ncbi:Beta-barrel assembly-enhancing protease (plasmid) [Roseobacter fucihabitans]|uniref:Beta-barrel assembly-enhancing protease n=1 Tax=Roseobacter fucihabitans TaxID=1537242 RepID=A0ABZ2C3P0_9RHOB|nr:tetratricopeptide repeat protein [Roseobacter litoralis]MBC6966917.1 tetratricopeptide repeat protein [Roseobacter litoralis]
MRKLGMFKTLPIMLVIALTLSACKSSEERAEEFYQSGLELIEAGDYDRGIVELRNVFEFDGSHREARFLLASTMLEEQDNRRGAYGQFLRLAEQYPDDLQTRILLSELAFDGTNWEEFERHGTKAVELDADAPRVRAIAIALAYREAFLADDEPGRREQARAAQELLNTLPDSVMMRKLVLDTMLLNGELDQAMEALAWLIEREPDNILYWRQRLNILLQNNDMEGLEAQLLEMVERFPDDVENKQMLLQFYISRDQQEDAEAFLRQLAVAAAEGDNTPRADLINYLLQVKGAEAALAELDAAIAEEEDPVPFQVIRAGIIFAQGEQNEAIADLEEILETAEPSEQTNNIKIALARMMLSTGNEVGARAHVEEVLVADAGHPMALKMQASWQIRSDDADGAINSLRAALDRTPDDAQAMGLMAEAYARSGRPELSQDFLALAVEASGNAPEESLRYAEQLIGQERYLPAEDILIPALRLQPQNVALLSTLGQLYLRMEDMGRTEQVFKTLANIDTPAAQQASRQLEAQWISANNGVDEAIAYLEGIASSADATLSNQVELVRVRLATGDSTGALALARELLSENPDNLALQAITASVEAANGNLEAAITTYRDILEAEPLAANVWLELARVTQRQDGDDAANAIINEALVAAPEDANLLWASASYRERAGDIDGAIEIYEALYARNSNSVVIANNLASMLSTYRTDETSLERAWAVARRFRDTDIPAMQDTFGWILQRRGESGEALPYLESAAQGLPNDPVVQYHLGKAYAALERPEEAMAQFRKAVQIAGPDDQRAQIIEARALIAASEGGATEN